MPIEHGYQYGSEAHIGSGTIIYHGERLSDGRQVMVKTHREASPSPTVSTKLRREFEIGRLIENDHVVAYYEILKLEAGLAVITEDFGGSGLALQIPQRGFDVETFLDLATQLAIGVEGIHQCGIIHKDLKPQNMVLNPKSRVIKIIDFGIASQLGREQQRTSNLNRLEGTWAYMSPEQTGRVNRPLDYRTDFYSLGVTFYQLLAGRLPFEANDALGWVHSHIARVPVPLHLVNPEIPRVVSDIVAKLMEKQADMRYQSSQGLFFDLAHCQEVWKKNGEIPGFPIATKDISPQFRIPQKLYGREQETGFLLDAFDRACQGKTTCLLVSGYAGIGKSALIHEVQKPVTLNQGFFVSGKYDQLNRNTAYSAISAAFRGLTRQLIGEGKANVATWKARLEEALESSGRLVIDIIPEVEWIIGEQPEVPQRGSTEVQNRFARVFKKFVQAFAQPEHPLVLFLDDLQWADTASLNLLQTLLTDEDSHHLLVIGAYRDHEVDPVHPFMLAVDAIRASGLPIFEVSLQPLEQHCIHALIADTLHKEPSEVEPLGTLVMEKTGGNPFFVNEFLKVLHQENLLRFDRADQTWTWNIADIAAQGITDNVVELMIARLRKFDKPVQEALSLGACIGNTFDLETLALISEQSIEQIAATLWPAVEAGVLVPQEEGHAVLWERHRHKDVSESKPIQAIDAFQHDRVQQAAYALIPEADRPAIHLRIGRLLRNRLSESVLQGRIFSVVNQFGYSLDLIEDIEERRDLSTLYLQASKKARAATAFPTALHYIDQARQLLPPDAWENSFDLAYNICVARSECAYLNGQIPEALDALDTALTHTQTPRDQAVLLKTKSRYYTNLPDTRKAKETALQALALLGIEVSEDDWDYDARLQNEVKALAPYLEEDLVDKVLKTGQNEDEEAILLIDLLVHACLPLFQEKRLDIGNWLVYLAIQLSWEKGGTAYTPLAYVIFGMNAGHILENYRLAYRFGEAALKIQEILGNVEDESQVLFWHALHLNHFGQPIRQSLHLYDRVYRVGVETGDLMHPGFTVANTSSSAIQAGLTVAELKDYMAQQRQMGQKISYVDDHFFFDIYSRFLVALEGGTTGLSDLDGDGFLEEKHMAWVTEKLEILKIWLIPIKLMLLVIEGRNREAIRLARTAEPIQQIMPVVFYSTCFTFFYTLALLLDEEETTPEIEDVVRRNIDLMGQWKEACPENYEHMYHLLRAEHHRRGDHLDEALEAYGKAIDGARKNQFLHHEALANERVARYWEERGHPNYARLHLKEAYTAYDRWGAKPKCAALARKLPGIFKPKSISTSQTEAAELDLHTLIKMAQAISSEIDVDRLLSDVMQRVVENAGAQKGFLFLQNEQDLYLEATAHAETMQVTTGLHVPLVECSDVSQKIVNVTQRVGEPIVLHDAAATGDFVLDPYVIQSQSRSVMCIPLRYKNQATGVLYLENNLSRGVFTVERKVVLETLMAQAAISLENARLYARLKAEIEDRKQIEQTLRQSNAELERFTYTVSHDLKTPLVTIKGFLGLLLQDMDTGRTDRIASNLSHIATAADHMRLLLDDLLELSRIGRVVNPSEWVSMDELVEQVLLVLHAKVAEAGTKVTVAMQMPSVFGDRTRLFEVVQNLLDNAIKFSAGQELPHVEIGVRNEADDTVYFVRDNGLGIPPAYQEKVFGLFNQLDLGQEGTGIGLAIVKRIVELHGGQVWVESEEQETGATFCFTIPTASSTIP